MASISGTPDIYSDLGYFHHKRIRAYPRGHEEYERSVATPNLLFRYSRPVYVVQPERKEQVAIVIKWLRKNNRKVTIKCGGHSSAGYSTAGVESVSLDLRRMNQVELNWEQNVAEIDAGACWGNVYKTFINEREDGYFINGGRCPLVGVSGYTLGGGLGPFSRNVGMGCDTVSEMTIVTAEGDLVTVKEPKPHESDSEESEEEKKNRQLFWALRGAGAANFGVLVGMKMKIQKLRDNNKVVTAGRYQWFIDESSLKKEEIFDPKGGFPDTFMETMRFLYETDWSRSMTIDNTWICECKDNKTKIGARYLVYYDGMKREFVQEIAEKGWEKMGPAGWSVAGELSKRCMEEPSTMFFHETLVNLWSFETQKAFPTNKTYSIYTSFCFENTSENIKEITDLIKSEMQTFRIAHSSDNCEFLFSWIHAGGQTKEQPENGDTSFFWRKATYHCYITLEWSDKWLAVPMKDFMESTKAKFRPLSLDGKAIYINFPDTDHTASHEEAYFGDNVEELRQVKKMMDPAEFFSWNHGIKLPRDPKRMTTMKKVGIMAHGKAEAYRSADFIAHGDWNTYQTRDFTDELKDMIDLGPDAGRYLY